MNSRIYAILASLAMVLPVSGVAAERYSFDTVHTQIIFFADHLGFSKSEGEFLDFSGYFEFDEKDWKKSRVEVTIDASSIDMGSEKWDAHMKNEDFFHVEKYPTISFRSRRVSSQDGKTGTILGDLTILGVTKPMTLEVTLNRVAPHPFRTSTIIAGFSAKGTLKRSDFGMTYGLPAVGDEIELRIEVEGNRS